MVLLVGTEKAVYRWLALVLLYEDVKARRGLEIPYLEFSYGKSSSVGKASMSARMSGLMISSVKDNSSRLMADSLWPGS